MLESSTSFRAKRSNILLHVIDLPSVNDFITWSITPFCSDIGQATSLGVEAAL